MLTIINKIKQIFLFLSLLFLISSCATSYKRASNHTSTGYYDILLQDNMYEVTFNGNSETNLKIAQDYALLRAAETCLENGYQTFDIVNTQNNSKTETGAFTSYGYYNSTTYVASETYPRITLIIKCSKDNNLTFIATQIKNNLREKYKLQDKIKQ